MPTWEEAKRCPRCDKPGEETAVNKGPKGSKVITLTCRTEGCKWFNTSWVVQVNADGSIPERQAGEKEFPEMDMSYGKRIVEQTKRELGLKEVPK